MWKKLWLTSNLQGIFQVLTDHRSSFIDQTVAPCCAEDFKA